MFEPHEAAPAPAMRHVDIAGHRIAYRHHHERDDRPTLLFCHALATHSGIWSATEQALAPLANRLVFDLPGHGQSICAAGQPLGFADLAGIAHTLLDHLGIARVHLIGVSVGGEVAQAFAAAWPERVGRMVLASTACHTAAPRATLWAQRIREVEAGGMAGIATATAQRWFSVDFAAAHPATVQACADAIAATDPLAYRRLAAVIAGMDLRPGNRTIAAPTLITFGSEDHNTGAAAGAVIASSIADARTAEIARSGHFPHIEQAEAWTRTVADFLFAAEQRR